MMFEVPSHFRCLRVVGKGLTAWCEAIDRKAQKGKERVAIKKIKEALYSPDAARPARAEDFTLDRQAPEHIGHP